MSGKPHRPSLSATPLFAKGDWWVLGTIVLALLLSGAYFAYGQDSMAPSGGRGLVLEIRQHEGDRIVMSVDALRTQGAQSWELEGPTGGLRLLYTPDEGFCVSSTSCPDLVCVRTGVISKAGQSIVCVPNEIVIRLVTADGGKGDVLDGILR